MLELFGRKIKPTKLTVITGVTSQEFFRELHNSNSSQPLFKYFGTDVHKTPLEQRQIAKELVQRVKDCVNDNIMLITNSDFCIKELNIYIMIHSLDHGISDIYPEYSTGCGLSCKLVSAYDFYDGKLNKSKVSKHGVEVKSFDIEIDYQNEVSRHILYGNEGWN